MDDNLMYVFVAFLISWIVIGGYLVTLGRQVQNLREEADELSSEAISSPESPRPTSGQERASVDPITR